MSVPLSPEGFLRTLFVGQGFLELRCFAGGELVRRKFYALSDPRSFALTVGLAGSQKTDAYFGVYPRKVNDSGKAEEVVERVSWLFCDLDGVEGLPEGFPAPTITVDSGGGPGHQHLYWKLSEPIPKEEASRLSRAIATSLGGDVKATDVARVLRVPGTVNSKTGQPCQVVEYNPEAIYAAADFAGFAVPSDEHTTDPITELARLLAPYCLKDEHQRHAIALALSGFLAKVGWPWGRVRQVIETLAEASGDEESFDRLRACEDTFGRVRENKPVRGYKGLEELAVPKKILEQLEDVARQAIHPAEMRRIDDLRFADKKAWQRNRAIAEEVISTLNEQGRFLRCDTGELFWFEHESKRIFSLEGEDMQALLQIRFGLNKVEKETQHLIGALQAECREHGEETAVHRTVFWNRREHVLYLDAGGGLIYRLDGTEIKRIDNGQDGVFFLREVDKKDAFVADLDDPLNPYEALAGDLSFETGTGVALAPKQQSQVFWLWVRSLFFPEEQPTKPLLALIGDAGSGKTSALRRILVLLHGAKANVGGIGKEDDFDAAVTTSHLTVMDNVDEQVKWLPEKLNRAATGQEIVKRQLYKTLEKITYSPRGFVALTSIDPPFKEATVADRMLILRMARRESFAPEGQLQDEVLKKRSQLLGGLLLQLNKDVKALRATVPVVQFRMADWASVILRLEPGSKELLAGLRTEQSNLVLTNSCLPPLIEAWVSENGSVSDVLSGVGDWLRPYQLYASLRAVSERTALPFTFKSPRGLSFHLSHIWQPLKEHLDAQGLRCEKQSTRREYLYRFASGSPRTKGKAASPTRGKRKRESADGADENQVSQ